MKGLRIAIAVVLCGMFMASQALAVTSVNLSVSASLQAVTPDMTVIVKELTAALQDPWSGTTVSSMDFGQLTNLLPTGAGAGYWYSPKYFCVLILAFGNSYKYDVKSTCAGLSSGTASLPVGSFMLVPDYATGDRWNPSDVLGQGTMLGSLGAKLPAVGTDLRIYHSDAGTATVPPKNAILRAFYSIPSVAPTGSTGWVGVPLNQAGGTYNGSVTITIAPY